SVSVLLFFGIGPRPAAADLKVCNKAPVPLYVASLYPSGNTWIAEGWWYIWPDDCATVVSGQLKNRKYYTYTESDNGFFKWEGETSFCASYNAFKISQEECKANGSPRTVKYKERDVGDALDYSFNKICTTDCGLPKYSYDANNKRI